MSGEFTACPDSTPENIQSKLVDSPRVVGVATESQRTTLRLRRLETRDQERRKKESASFKFDDGALAALLELETDEVR